MKTDPFPTPLACISKLLIYNTAVKTKPYIHPDGTGTLMVVPIGSTNIPGIAPEYYKRIPNIFQRLHIPTEYQSSGIGLSHCKKIVELHHRKIRVNSTPNEGSTFYFTIHSHKEDIHETKIKLHTLNNDDEPTNFYSTILLEEANCTDHIQIAESGQQALNYLTNSEQDLCNSIDCPCPDITFLDINMPAMNGWEFLEKYQRLEGKYRGKINIIMHTTSLNPDDKIRALEMPEVSGFENKPLTIEIINRVVKKYYNPQLLKPIEAIQ